MPVFRDRLGTPHPSVMRVAAAATMLGAALASSGAVAFGHGRSGDHRVPAVVHPDNASRAIRPEVLPASLHTAAPATDRFPLPAPVAAGRATQAIAVQACGSYATVVLWARAAGSWHPVAATAAARIGAHGITDGATRTQGTGTTPTGTYTITEGFGVGADPGTRMPYHQVTAHDWWVEDPSSAYYNRMRTDTQGGFHLTESGVDGSEHLINYPVQYRNALVVDFNMNPTVKGRGAGIFLHALGPQAGPTSGCVAVPAEFMTRVMHWIDPADHPVIVIG